MNKTKSFLDFPKIKNDSIKHFDSIAIELFNLHYKGNKVYRNYCDCLNVYSNEVLTLQDIPFLPVEFFKSHEIYLEGFQTESYFSSSTTTGQIPSKHFYHDIDIYENSFESCFNLFYGSIKNYAVLALLPSYLEREGSSLVYMANKLIIKSNNKESGFFLNNLDDLKKTIERCKKLNQNYILLGVSFALLDFAEKFQMDLSDGIVMETGGMKGRRKELIREELHQQLKSSFNLSTVHSEYGMTELLTQAYSKGEGTYYCPPWMKILIRETNDYKKYLPTQKSGCINIIDFANLYSCPFISTQDIGKLFIDGGFQVLGRMDQADLRGCNLMVM